MNDVTDRLLTKEEILSRSIPFTRLINIENASVIYFLICEGEIIYIGQSIKPSARMSHHKAYKSKKFDSYSFLYVDDLHERLELESDYIDEYKPCCNGENTYRRIKLNQATKELIMELNKQFDSFILIAKNDKFNKIYFDSNPHWSITTSLFDSVFKKYPKIKRLLKINFFNK